MLLSEDSHAFQPIPGWDVLKQHTEYQFAGAGPAASKDSLKLVHPMMSLEPKFFTASELWGWAMQMCGPWWHLGFLMPASICAQCACL